MNKATIIRNAIAAGVVCAMAQATSASGFRAAPVADYKENAWSFGIEGGAAYVGGEAREHIFMPKSQEADYAEEFGKPIEGRRHQMSRLDWDMSAAMFGAAGSARRGRLSFNFGIWYGGSGDDDNDMKDYDWMEGDDVPHSEYSRSDTELTDAWMFDANVSFDVVRSGDFTGYIFAGAREQRWKWTCDGRNDYKYSDDNYVWTHDHAHVCDYRQVLFFGYIGAGGVWKLSDTLSLSAYASWAPGWKGRDRDNHITAGKLCRETFDYDGDVYAAGVALDVRVAEHATLFVGLDWQKATINQGDSIQFSYEDDEVVEENLYKDFGGMENEYVAVSFGVKYAF